MSRNLTRPELHRLGDNEKLLCARLIVHASLYTCTRLNARNTKRMAAERGHDEKLAAGVHIAA